MRYLKGLIFLVAIPLILCGCTNVSSVLTLNNNKNFELVFENNLLPKTLDGISRKSNLFAIKLTPEFRRYCRTYTNHDVDFLSWQETCKFRELPKQLTITYAKTSDNPHSASINSRNDFLQTAEALPPSAWRTYTIYPQQVIEKAKTMPVLVNGELKPYDPAKYPRGTTVTLILSIDDQGKITQEVKHEIIYRNNPAT